MKTLITALALAALLAAACIPPANAGPNDVTMGGKNIGADPDANVRLQMRRDFGSEGY
jgi:hypothetical protein